MSIQYSITEYKFVEPYPINELQFVHLKKELSKNPNFTLIDNSETFFKKYRWFFLICILLLPIALAGAIYFLMEVQSMIYYYKYLKEKREYYETLEFYIKESDTYFEFYNSFYE